MNDQPAARTPTGRTRKPKAARSRGKLLSVPDPKKELSTDEIFDFAIARDGYVYTKRIGVDGFDWADELLDRFDASGELPDDQDALLALPFVMIRQFRFSPFDTDQSIQDAMHVFRAIFTKLHAMGVTHVDILE